MGLKGTSWKGYVDLADDARGRHSLPIIVDGIRFLLCFLVTLGVGGVHARLINFRRT